MASSAAKKRIAVVVGSRANYGSIKSAMRAIQDHPELELVTITAASAMLDRYGTVENIIERDGFSPEARVYMLLEGETPLTMAKSTGIGMMEVSTAFDRLKPDVVVTVGDRFETMATAVAAAYMNIPLAHTMGGEITGTIDESVRHAVTKLAHIHFPSSDEAGKNIVRMGEDPDTVHVVGCPRIDLVKEVLQESSTIGTKEMTWDGVGSPIDLSRPYLLVSQYAVTTEYGQGKSQIEETLSAIDMLKIPAVMLWPNADAGGGDVASGIRGFRERTRGAESIHFFKNLPPEQYTRLMNGAACVLGNTSSSIREGAFMGTPAVNVGTRQAGRERGPNVLDVGHDRDRIVEAVRKQIDHGKYPSDLLYGSGNAGTRIAEILSESQVSVQKKLVFR